MNQHLSWIWAGLAALAMATGCDCSGDEADTAGEPTHAASPPGEGAGGPVGVHGDELPPGHPPGGGGAAPGAPAGGAGGMIRGTVTETMDSGGYTYMQLDTPNGAVWVAAMQMAVAVGDPVEVAGGAPMRNFHSNSLDRTFETILFANSARVASGAGGPAPGGPAPVAPPIEEGAELPANHPPIAPTGGPLAAPAAPAHTE